MSGSAPARIEDPAFLRCCLPHGGRPAIFTLVPPGSPLAALAESLVSRHGSADSLAAIGPRGLDFVALRSWCGARQRGRQSVLCLAAAAELSAALERLERLELCFRLAAGSVVVEFETGYDAGSALLRADRLARLTTRLGVPAASVVRAYFPPELESPAYTAVLAGGDPDLFGPPAGAEWCVVDRTTLAPLPAGEVGGVAVVEGSGESKLTLDLGLVEAGGLRLVARVSA